MLPSPVPATVTPAAYTDYLNLSYRPDLRMVVLRWLRDASLPEVQLGHQAALHLARQHGVTHWFVDVRRLMEITSSHSCWLIDEFLPQVTLLLPTPLRVSCLMSPSLQKIVRERVDLQSVISRAQLPASAYCLQAFLDESSATTWLCEA